MSYKRISPQPVVEGGTGAQTLTSNGVLLGNTTSAITATSAGTTGQVLTGVTGNAPTFQAPAASSITVTGDSGGALTGNSFTFTGASTGLTFAGAGSTETLGGTLAIANGGTNATSFTQSNGIVTYNGTRLVNYAGPQINSSGIQTNTTQPSFSARANTPVNYVTGDGTTYTMIFPIVDSNQGSNYNSSTGVFTAPATGLYYFYGAVQATDITAQNVAFVQLTATINTFIANLVNPAGLVISGQIGLQIGAAIYMSSGDTCSFAMTFSNSTKTVNFGGNNCYFGGYLVC